MPRSTRRSPSLQTSDTPISANNISGFRSGGKDLQPNTMHLSSAKSKFALLALALALTSAGAYAQGRGPGGGGGHGGPPPGGGGFPGASHGGFPSDNRGGFPGDNRNNFPSRNHGGFGHNAPVRSAPRPQFTHPVVQLGPSGRWWDDKKFSRSVGIDDDTRKRMDSIFNDNKGTLTDSFKSLQREEQTLGKLIDAKEPDEPAILAQIDRVAQARADLEKASTRLVLALRRSLSPEQQSKLEAKTRQLQEEQQQESQLQEQQ
ncbi:MAG: periplasmic heavy metal sensor [Acidobacteria bacterium]|nr:periplasmic heavy metal sensor [Acidobacteriota bacterium]